MATRIQPLTNGLCVECATQEFGAWLNGLDKLFWVSTQHLWSEWKNSLVVVTPDTVVRWHPSVSTGG
jgi:hypothetical protein